MTILNRAGYKKSAIQYVESLFGCGCWVPVPSLLLRFMTETAGFWADESGVAKAPTERQLPELEGKEVEA